MRRAIKKQCAVDEEYRMDRRERRRATERRYLRWNDEENREYVNFMMDNIDLFEDEVSRKNSMVFTKMAQELKNGRDNHQCRSHHIKLMQKFGNLQQIMEGLKLGLKDLKKTEQEVKSVQLRNKETQAGILGDLPDLQQFLTRQVDVQESSLFKELCGPSFKFL